MCTEDLYDDPEFRQLNDHVYDLFHLGEVVDLDSLIPAHRPEFHVPLRRLLRRLSRKQTRPPPSPPMPPPQCLGRYRLIKELGQGSFGTVWLAHDPTLQRDVAIKVSNPNRFSGRSSVEDFVEEARRAAELRHAGITTVYDVGEVGGQAYIVMEYISGGTLRDVLLARGTTCSKFVRGIRADIPKLVAEVAASLDHAHGAGIIHRDLKPSNVLIDRDGNPHIADFGLAVSAKLQDLSTLHTAGTVAYMSPEQISGQPLDHRTDIWSLGVILYELLTGRHPFDVIGNRDPLTPFPAPRDVRATIPRRLSTICMKAMAKHADDRYQRARDLCNDLRGYGTAPHGYLRELLSTSPRPTDVRNFIVKYPGFLQLPNHAVFGIMGDSDSVDDFDRSALGVCTNCFSFLADVEPQDADGWCVVCGEKSVRSLQSLENANDYKLSGRAGEQLRYFWVDDAMNRYCTASLTTVFFGLRLVTPFPCDFIVIDREGASGPLEMQLVQLGPVGFDGEDLQDRLSDMRAELGTIRPWCEFYGWPALKEVASLCAEVLRNIGYPNGYVHDPASWRYRIRIVTGRRDETDLAVRRQLVEESKLPIEILSYDRLLDGAPVSFSRGY